MWNDRDDDVLIALDLKIKPPAPGHADLPQIRAFVIFFGVQRGILKIAQQEAKLFGKCLANLDGEVRIVPVSRLGEAESHLRRFFTRRLARASSAAIASSTVA